MCCCCKVDTLVGKFNAVGIASRSESNGGSHAIGTVTLWTAVVIEVNYLSQSKINSTVEALSHQNLILQCALTLRVAVCNFNLRACIDRHQFCIDGAVFFCVSLYIYFHSENIVTLCKGYGFRKSYCYLGCCGCLAEFCIVLPNTNI